MYAPNKFISTEKIACILSRTERAQPRLERARLTAAFIVHPLHHSVAVRWRIVIIVHRQTLADCRTVNTQIKSCKHNNNDQQSALNARLEEKHSFTCKYVCSIAHCTHNVWALLADDFEYCCGIVFWISSIRRCECVLTVCDVTYMAICFVYAICGLLVCVYIGMRLYGYLVSYTYVQKTFLSAAGHAHAIIEYPAGKSAAIWGWHQYTKNAKRGLTNRSQHIRTHAWSVIASVCTSNCDQRQRVRVYVCQCATIFGQKRPAATAHIVCVCVCLPTWSLISFSFSRVRKHTHTPNYATTIALYCSIARVHSSCVCVLFWSAVCSRPAHRILLAGVAQNRGCSPAHERTLTQHCELFTIYAYIWILCVFVSLCRQYVRCHRQVGEFLAENVYGGDLLYICYKLRDSDTV